MTLRNISIVMTLLAIAGLLVLSVVAHPAVTSANNGFEAGTTVQIGDNGNVLVRGASVTAVSGSTITARTSWGDTDISWRIETDSDTEFVTRSGADSARSSIAVGNEVSVSGNLDEDGGAFVIDAEVVRNWSENDVRATFSGSIESVNDGSFVLDTKKNGEITVLVDSGTDIEVRSEDDAELADLSAGAYVTVSGTYDDEDETLDAERVTASAKHSGNAWGFWKNFGNHFSGNVGFWKR